MVLPFWELSAIKPGSPFGSKVTSAQKEFKVENERSALEDADMFFHLSGRRHLGE